MTKYTLETNCQAADTSTAYLFPQPSAGLGPLVGDLLAVPAAVLRVHDGGDHQVPQHGRLHVADLRRGHQVVVDGEGRLLAHGLHPGNMSTYRTLYSDSTLT